MSPESQVAIVVVLLLTISFFLMVKVSEFLLDAFCCLVERAARTIEDTAPHVGAVCSRVTRMEEEDFDRTVETIKGIERVASAALRLVSTVRDEWPFGSSEKDSHHKEV